MIISKNIIGTIDIDTTTGRVWLNAPNCILRIQGLEFKELKEKFSMIDISGNKASMIEGNLILDDKRLVRFILDLFSSLSYNTINGKIKNKDKFLDDLFLEINRRIDEQ
jgi:hypothetical protein